MKLRIKNYVNRTKIATNDRGKDLYLCLKYPLSVSLRVHSIFGLSFNFVKYVQKHIHLEYLEWSPAIWRSLND